MVLTRSQKTKEEDDIKLAEQQSLVEQVQQVPASQEGQNELEATTATSQNVSQEDVSRNTSGAGVVRRSDTVPPVSTNDVSQVNVVKPKVLESELSKPIVPSVDFVKQDISKTSHSKQNASKQDAIQQDVVLHPVSLPPIGQQNGVESLTKPDSGQSTSNVIVVETTGDQYSNDQHSGDEHLADEHLSDGYLGNEPLHDEHSGNECPDEDLLDAEHSDGGHTDVKHADAEHADAEHADAEHADAEHADAEHADAEHADAEHANAEHTDVKLTDVELTKAKYPDGEHSDAEHSDDDNEHSDDEDPGAEHHSNEYLDDEQLSDEYRSDEYSGDEYSGDEHPGDERPGDERPGDERPGDEHPGDKHPGDEHPNVEHFRDEHLSDGHPDNKTFGDEDTTLTKPMQINDKVKANESGSIKTKAKYTKTIRNVTTLSRNAILPVTPGAEYSQRYSFRSRVKKTKQSVLTEVEESITTVNIITNREASVSHDDEDDEDVDTSGSDPGDKLTDLSAPDGKIEEHDGDFQPTTARYGKKEVNLASKKAPINKTGLQQNSAVSGLTSKKVPSVTGRPGTGVSDNVQASISDSKRSVRARGRTAPKVKGKQYDSAGKHTQGTKQSPRVDRIDDVDLDIPINPEDEDEFVPEKGTAIVTPNTRSLRDRTKISTYRKKVVVTTRSRTTTLSKAPSSKKSRAANIVKARQSDTQEKHLIVKLSHGEKLVATWKVKRPKNRNRVPVPKSFYTNKYRFKFGWSPFVKYPKVHTKTYQEVYNLLAESLAPEGISLNRKSGDEIIIDGVSQGPMHGGEAVTVDVLVKVIMSQATNNENALSAQARLISAFPYFVNGETVVGKTPNYHEVRRGDNKTKLQNALAPAGLHVIRSKAIADCLNAIRQKNIDANSPGCDIDSNPPDAADFVPGSLSLKYLDALSKEEKMDELLDLDLVGVKTAMCILAFAYGLPVFAVDTHVHRMVQWLGWVPENCNRDDAAAHLDHFIPDHLKYGLHQGFWHHGQKCLRCKAKNDPNTKGWEDAVCVLEEYLKRHPKKERKSPGQKRKEVDDEADADSPKPKVRKGNKTMTTKAVSEEEAVANGWVTVKQEILMDDNFGTPGANFTGRKQVIWINTATI